MNGVKFGATVHTVTRSLRTAEAALVGHKKLNLKVRKSKFIYFIAFQFLTPALKTTVVASRTVSTTEEPLSADVAAASNSTRTEEDATVIP